MVCVPGADAESVAVKVNVAVALTGRLTVALMLPLLAVEHVPPPASMQVHVAPFSVAGFSLVTVPPLPGFTLFPYTTLFRSTGFPGTAVVEPSVLVIARSAVGLIVSVSVAELLPGFGAETSTGAT